MGHTGGDRASRQQFIEEMGIVLERLGIPRMAGKIFGCLLLTPLPELPAETLTRELQASRGSISTMTRLLIQLGLVDRVGRPGERRDYFRVRAETWSSILKARMHQLIELHDLIERGMELVPRDASGAYPRLRAMHEFYTFFEREFPSLFERWEQEQRDQGKTDRT